MNRVFRLEGLDNDYITKVVHPLLATLAVSWPRAVVAETDSVVSAVWFLEDHDSPSVEVFDLLVVLVPFDCLVEMFLCCHELAHNVVVAARGVRVRAAVGALVTISVAVVSREVSRSVWQRRPVPREAVLAGVGLDPLAVRGCRGPARHCPHGVRVACEDQARRNHEDHGKYPSGRAVLLTP